MPGWNNGNHGIGGPPKKEASKTCVVKDCGGKAFYSAMSSAGKVQYFCEKHRELARKVASSRVAYNDIVAGEYEREHKEIDAMILRKESKRRCARGHS